MFYGKDQNGIAQIVEADAVIRGAEAQGLIPRVQAAIAAYGYNHAGDYRVWPGPNSNTFTASVLRAVAR